MHTAHKRPGPGPAKRKGKAVDIRSHKFKDAIKSEIIPRVNLVALEKSMLTDEKKYAHSVFGAICSAMRSAYGGHTITNPGKKVCLVTVPGVALTEKGVLMLALITLDIADKEEKDRFRDTGFICRHGVLQEDCGRDSPFLFAVESFVPYVYGYAPTIPADKSTDRNTLPEEIRGFLGRYWK
jgi:hypothetical protein